MERFTANFSICYSASYTVCWHILLGHVGIGKTTGVAFSARHSCEKISLDFLWVLTKCGSSPLTSLIKKGISTHRIASDFSFFTPFRVNLVYSVYRLLWKNPETSKQACHSDWDHLAFGVSINWSSCFYKLHCCPLIGWLDNCINKQNYRHS